MIFEKRYWLLSQLFLLLVVQKYNIFILIINYTYSVTSAAPCAQNVDFFYRCYEGKQVIEHSVRRKVFTVHLTPTQKHPYR